MFKAKKFKKNFRIRQKILFDQVLVQRNKLFGKYCILYFKINKLEYPRLGILVSKKKLSLAVERNQFKRVAREAVRLNQKELAGFDLVLIGKEEAKNVSKKELSQCLENLFMKLKAH